MGQDRADPDEIARAVVARMCHVAALPRSTRRLLQVVDDPNSSPHAIVECLSSDAALATRLLKVANSAFYGLRRRVGSVDHAVSVLGRDVVRNVAVASSMANLLPVDHLHPSFSVAQLWRHSIGTAAACRALAFGGRIGDPEEAFVAGLIHDVGILIELQAERERFALALRDVKLDEQGAPLDSLEASERKHLGADHRHFGAALCEAWGLPPSLVIGVAHHHVPFAAPEEARGLAMLVHMGERLGTGFEHGFPGTPPPLSTEAVEELGFDPSDLPALQAQIEEEIDLAEAAFGAAS